MASEASGRDRTGTARFLMWGALGLVTTFVALEFWLLAVPFVAIVLACALLRSGRESALGGLLAGSAPLLAYFGYVVGSRDRECQSGEISSDGVETCTQWVAAGSPRWPWFLAAAVLLTVGLALHADARRRARARVRARAEAAAGAQV